MLYCETCYEQKLTECPEAITVKGGLTADTDYYIRVTDKFGNCYTQAVTTNSSGNFDLPINATYPAGLFNAVSGTFKMEASLTANPWVPVNLTFSTVPYPCILFSFYTDVLPNSTIQ